jgi:hypothetical protein
MYPINKDHQTDEGYTYIENHEQFTERVKRYEKPIFQEGFEAGIFKAARNGIQAGLSNEVIQTITKLSEEELNSMRRDLK